MKPLRTFLWFDDQAEEAVGFYKSIFAGVKVGKIARYGDAGPVNPER
jgi:predicted 3-demethylubiquinone-9 3-methyltransferase (glyoxalase superfamily)